MAQTLSRVRYLAHSGGYGVRTRVMLASGSCSLHWSRVHLAPAAANEFQHEFTPRDSRRGFREYILDLGEAGSSSSSAPLSASHLSKVVRRDGKAVVPTPLRGVYACQLVELLTCHA
jgi:hypothetical protein